MAKLGPAVGAEPARPVRDVVEVVVAELALGAEVALGALDNDVALGRHCE